MKYAILVVWLDGVEEYVKQGSDVAIFHSKRAADEQAEFMRMGMEDECQSINVVQYPSRSEKAYA
jgi:hypothetical protein